MSVRPMTTTAEQVQVGQQVQITAGPKAGHTGTVETVRVCEGQLGTNLRTAIIDFADGSRSVRPAGESVLVVE